MATPSNPEEQWVFAQKTREPHALNIRMRVAIRSIDGWVKVLDLETDGWLEDSPPSRRRVLENIQENIVTELAKLTLEET